MDNMNFRPDDFELINRDSRISDKELATKPTTFFKDALRRFRKNKSSVAGAYILGALLLLTIIVPLVSSGNITKVSTQEAFLAPKLFNAGTGFWDGTRVKEGIVYDRENEVPALSEKYSVASIKQSMSKLKVDAEPSLIDAANKYANGGVVVLSTDAKVADKNCLMLTQTFEINDTDCYTLDVEFGTEQDVSGSKLGEYRVSFVSVEDDLVIILRDLSMDYSPLSVDLSAILAQAGLKQLKGSLCFEVVSSEDAFRYILLKSVRLDAGAKAKNLEQLAAMSFTDANAFVLISDTKAPGYWPCTGRKGIHNAEIYYCSCVIDTYMLVYGDADAVTYAASELNSWVDAGLCEYDPTVGPESFKALSDDCPISNVESQTMNNRTKKLSAITAHGFNYKKLGYDEMPKFVLGTDASGFDLFKRAFAGLRTSLILGICTAAFCFCFGLIWGSVSGYFGGNVDLYMERFCEILGGVPWIVVMTLCILHLGNNFLTFFFALCLTGWMGTAARTRTQFYRFKGREYVLASRTLGSSDMRLIFKHILPNSMGTIITSSVLMIPSTIFSEATLAYLNLGLQGKQSFGVMMSANQQHLDKYPYLVIFPACIMALMMISFNLFGNGLRDAFNPSLKGSD